MNETKQKGLITEIECELAFAKLGILLSKPVAEDNRYDYIADLDNNFLRIQCKTSSVAQDGSYIEFATRSARSNTKENFTRNYTKQEIDYFYTCYDGKSYLVPVEECSASKKLRFTLPKNNQLENSSFAKDYELKMVLQKKENFTNFQIHQVNIINKTKENYKKPNICIKCGKPICENAKMCIQCRSIENRVVKRPSREQLKMLIKSTPFVQIGKQYNVTDNAIKKWCDSYSLPRTKREINNYSDQEWKEI